MSHVHDDPACDVAHGEAPAQDAPRVLVAVFCSPVAGWLVKFGTALGFQCHVYDPDPAREPSTGELDVLSPAADVVLTDHHREEIGPVLREVLQRPVRWVGIMGSPRHTGPHVQALAELGVPASEIARVHRPIGLNIGSRTPQEIALSTLAGLIADRNGRPGGFTF